MYSEPSPTSKMELFGKIVNDFQLLAIFSKSSISDAWMGYAFAFDIGGETEWETFECTKNIYDCDVNICDAKWFWRN